MRKLSKEERKLFLENRGFLHEQLSELQADFEDLSDEELLTCRDAMLKRVNLCLRAILETEEDNLC